VLEHITQKPITTLLQEEVLDVFDLDNTYFQYSPTLLAGTSHGHNGARPHANDIRPTAHVASSMIADTGDIATFFLGILNREGLGESMYAELFRKHTVTNPDTLEEEGVHYFGLGVYVEETPLGISFGHSGNNGDFKCNAMVFENTQQGYVVLTNNGYGDSIIYELDALLIDGIEGVPE
jgi:CubicO group peptidase (beta-lactamase class C family)